MSDMAIGLVTTSFDKGGLEQVIFNLYEGYKASGIPTYILCEKGSQMGYFASMLHDVRDFWIFENDFETFIAFCYRKKITHLHYHYNTSFIEKARNCGIRTIYTLHNVYTWFSDDMIKDYGKKLQQCDEIVAVSSLVKDYFCRRAGIREDMVTVIPNGIDISEITCKQELPLKLTREGLRIKENDIVFAQVASFTSVKHQIGLIGVMERVLQEQQNIKLLLVGNVIEEDYYNKFSDALEKSPARDHIIPVDFFAHKYMGEFLRKTVDIAVLATLQEGCSNFVLEAVACEKPTILTNVGNASDVKSKSVIVIPPDYDNICEESIESLVQKASQKKGRNTQMLANAFFQAVRNLDAMRQSAQITETQRNELGTWKMVESYLALLKEIS